LESPRQLRLPKLNWTFQSKTSVRPVNRRRCLQSTYRAHLHASDMLLLSDGWECVNLKRQCLWFMKIALVLLCPGCGAAQGQDAVVTFYSHGSLLTTGLPGTVHDVYIGSIFDGLQGIFSFRDGFFAHNNRFLSLRFAPGPHTFGASNGKRPESRETLDVDLKAGGQYFIRAQGESKGVPGILTIQHGRLDPMSCADAQKDMENAKPLHDKALWKKVWPQRASLIVDESSPPSCQ